MRKNLIWLPLIFILLFATSCKKDDPIDPPGTGNTLETSITFVTKDTSALEGILVGISSLAQDRDNGFFLRSGTTDSQGKIKFSNLDPQTFYYSCSRTISGGIVERTGSIEAVLNQKKTVTVTF